MWAIGFQVLCAAAFPTFSIALRLLSVTTNWIAFAAKAFACRPFALCMATALAFAAFAFPKEDFCIVFIREVGNQSGDAFSSEASMFSKPLSFALAFGLVEHMLANMSSQAADWFPHICVESFLLVGIFAEENFCSLLQEDLGRLHGSEVSLRMMTRCLCQYRCHSLPCRDASPLEMVVPKGLLL